MLERVNKFLQERKSEMPQEVVLQGPDTIKNIIAFETQKLAFLENINSHLLAQVADIKTINKLSYKEKQQLLRFLTDIQNDSRDFILNVAALCSKNQFLEQVLKLSTMDTITVESDNGETFESVISEERRKELTEMLRDAINDRARANN